MAFVLSVAGHPECLPYKSDSPFKNSVRNPEFSFFFLYFILYDPLSSDLFSLGLIDLSKSVEFLYRGANVFLMSSLKPVKTTKKRSLSDVA